MATDTTSVPHALLAPHQIILRPLVTVMAGGRPSPLVAMTVISGFDYTKKAGRREYVRVSLDHSDGAAVARKYPVDGAGVLTSLTRTDGMVELPEACTDVRIGGGPTTVRAFLREDLIDEMHLVVVPILLGRGERLWDGLEGLDERFCIESTPSPSGVVHLTFTRRDADRG